MSNVYLDHAATTPLDPLVLEAMLPYLKHQFGNASSAHRLGRTARVAIENSREAIAHVLQAKPETIIFTSGGTEANNLMLRGLCQPGDRLITSTIEHEAILQTATGRRAARYNVWTGCPQDQMVRSHPRSLQRP